MRGRSGRGRWIVRSLTTLPPFSTVASSYRCVSYIYTHKIQCMVVDYSPYPPRCSWLPRAFLVPYSLQLNPCLALLCIVPSQAPCEWPLSSLGTRICTYISYARYRWGRLRLHHVKKCRPCSTGLLFQVELSIAVFADNNVLVVFTHDPPLGYFHPRISFRWTAR